uniref:2,3-bisphosphoglycerate-independent phosphoglycerate mutase n=1 Tax=Membranoptera weeksiae TaxID=158720 RepID=A0A1N7T4J0_9FLOR|nr:phosphoglycerate mutase [Membranoptera weeksiae]AHZ94771.1 phosphoglycerate mutase [Membranoptera weeksiae]
MHNKTIYPIILTILDGWGYSEETKGNAIKLANTPTIDKVWNNYPHALLNASGIHVGLPNKQMGNSEVGHTTMGSGRVIDQDLVRIGKSIETKEFFNNQIIHNICQIIDKRKSKIHIIGLCSDGGVHSHINHLKALITIIKEYRHSICLHLITDGRDTAPKIATKFIQEILEYIKDYDHIEICTISGRYYSMDRDCRWSRIEKTYNILTEDNCIQHTTDCIQVINKYYENNISDEFIPPTRVKTGKITDNDGVLFFNFRPDRIRQLLHSLAKKNFKGFNTKNIKNLIFTSFTNYDSSLNIPTIFPSQNQTNFLGQIISSNGLKQLRLAETEKYAHVTYFFNGGTEEPFPGEDRELIPSPKVETYDLKPEMSAHKITESLIAAIDKNIYQLIVVNYANPDMIGHTGNLESTIEAIEVVDKCIEKILNKIKNSYIKLIITADHGNADYMIDKENKPCKSHSLNMVPFILVDNKQIFANQLKDYGSLADIAPTILDILNLNIPKEMNGQSLIITNNIKTLI